MILVGNVRAFLKFYSSGGNRSKIAVRGGIQAASSAAVPSRGGCGDARSAAPMPGKNSCCGHKMFAKLYGISLFLP